VTISPRAVLTAPRHLLLRFGEIESSHADSGAAPQEAQPPEEYAGDCNAKSRVHVGPYCRVARSLPSTDLKKGPSTEMHAEDNPNALDLPNVHLGAVFGARVVMDGV